MVRSTANQTILVVDGTVKSWKAFLDHVDFAIVLRKMLNGVQQQDEIMTSYYFTKMELLRTCQTFGRHAVSI